MSKTHTDATLGAGTRVDEYEILAPIGHGGMGEVYKARDTRVDRIVAIKVLPRAFAGAHDAEGRFEREARALAALNHPRICALFEFTRYDGTPLLVMEYVEGQTLAERLVNGRIPLNDAVRVAIEIADGLAAAHRAGLIHRDLKPANIMLTKSGAKLLDFGVAKLTRPVIASDEPTNTAGDQVTQVGVAVGTPSYMAPEQLSGLAADVRTDIWALGCVLYQMITGALPFKHATFADLGASPFEEYPPPVGANEQAGVAALDRVIRKCLAIDPDARWQSAADLRDALTWISSDVANSRALQHARVRRPWFWASAVLLAVAASATVGLFYGASTSRPSDSPVRHLELSVPRLAALESLALSPDGANLAFIGPDKNGIPIVWLRPMSRSTARVLSGTERADPQCPPFWSPDGQSLAFVADGKLRRIDINGGQAQPIADVSGVIFGGDWGHDGTILLGTYQLSKTHGIHRVSADGGALVPVVPLGSRTLLQAIPRFLTDGRRFVFLNWASDEQTRDVCVASLDDVTPRCLNLNAHVLAGLTDQHLLFTRGDTLYAQRFDSGTARTSGSPMIVASGLARDNFGRVSVSVAGSELLLYQAAAPQLRQLVWVNRDGTRLGTLVDVAVQTGLSMSDDGSWVAVERPSEQGDNVWIIDVGRGITTRAVTSSDAVTTPLLAPDGLRLVSLIHGEGRSIIVEQPTQGGEKHTLFEYAGEGILTLADRSRDGRYIVIGLAERNRRVTQVVSADGAMPPVTVAEGPVALARSRLSPDGRWLAYESSQTGQVQVFVTGVPPTGQHWQVSSQGGQQPEWRRDGRELFFLAPDGTIMSTLVDTTTRFDFSAARPLFRTELRGEGPGRRYAVTADGKRFLLSVPREGDKTDTTTTFRALLNWTHASAR